MKNFTDVLKIIDYCSLRFLESLMLELKPRRKE